MRSLILMIQFMTRYPIPLEIEFTAERFVRGMKWMPLVGLLVALPAAGALYLLDSLLGREIGALAAVIVLILVTGGLHLDGIADTADGLFSYRSRERMLAIMRDSTLGTNGVTAIVLSVLVKFVLVKNIPATGAICAVLAAPVLGRMALTWHSAVARYAREERPIITDSSLQEFHFGDWEGMHFAEIAREYPEVWQMWLTDWEQTRIPGGEAFPAFRERVVSFVEEVVASHPGRRVALVSHGGCIRSVLAHLFCGSVAKGYWKFKVDNASLAEIEFMGELPILLRFNYR